jgi:hypothetical protein
MYLAEPNIASYSVVRDSSQTINHAPPPARFLIRLVHGYNMPMCMKMKYYTVEKIQDHKVQVATDPKLHLAYRMLVQDGKDLTTKPTKNTKEDGEGLTMKGAEGDRETEERNYETREKHEKGVGTQEDWKRGEGINHKARKGHDGEEGRGAQALSDLGGKRDSLVPSSYTNPVQLWRLTSSVGTVSIWATTMIRSGDFEPTINDICTMAFPRVDLPDDPNWVPRGVTKESLKTPIASVKRWFRGRWDASRWDLLTFLKLRKPVWPSEEILSYVSILEDMPSSEIRADDVRQLLKIHEAMLKEMQAWRKSGGGMKRDEGGGER